MEPSKKLVSLWSDAGVKESNPYLFPRTQPSSSGWESISDVTKRAGITSIGNITATKKGHRASTIYALQDVPEHERAAFYRHMGHGIDVSESVYQCPAEVQEVCKVRRYFDNLDNRMADWMPRPQQESQSASSSSLQRELQCASSQPILEQGKQTLQYVCNKVIVKGPVIRYVRCYTIL